MASEQQGGAPSPIVPSKLISKTEMFGIATHFGELKRHPTRTAHHKVHSFAAQIRYLFLRIVGYSSSFGLACQTKLILKYGLWQYWELLDKIRTWPMTRDATPETLLAKSAVRVFRESHVARFLSKMFVSSDSRLHVRCKSIAL